MNVSPQKSAWRGWLIVGVLIVLGGGVAFFVRSRTASAVDRFVAEMIAGKIAFENLEADKAIGAFERALELEPAHADAHLNLANALLLAGRSEEAIQFGRKVLELNKDSAAALYVIGCAHLRLGQSEEALKALQQSRFIEPGVSAVSFQLGRAHQALSHWEDAATAFTETINLEPQHAAAHYALSQVLIRLGRSGPAQEELKIHQQIAATRPNLPSDTTVFEKCRHTVARLPDVKPEQPDASGVPVRFVDATSALFGDAAPRYRPLAIVDVPGTSRPSVFVHETDAGLRLLSPRENEFVAGPVFSGGGFRALVGDLDNDRLDDLLVLGGEDGVKVFKLAADGSLSDVSAKSGLQGLRASDGVLADFEVTGKLGLIAITDGAVAFWRNQGSMTFVDRTAALKIPPLPARAQHCVFDDWNGDDLPDLIVALDNASPWLLLNQHGGVFRVGSPAAARLLPTTNPAAQLPAATEATWPFGNTIACGELNGDFQSDLLVADRDGFEVVYGRLEKSTRVNLPSEFRFELVDYDNDGWLDIVAYGPALRVWRNLGRDGFRETTSDLGLAPFAEGAVYQISSLCPADLDSDGDTDLLFHSEAGLHFLRNDGGNSNRQVKVRFIGRRSNASGLGARLELLAGGWRTRRTFHRPWLEVGVGKRERLDSLAVHSADLVMNLGSIETDPKTPVVITELELPTGSCPYLYAWDGKRFRFITDLLGAAPAGLRLTDDRFIDADTDELVGIGDDNIIQPRDGSYVLQITDELRELFFFDHVQLVVADHPPEVEVHTTSKLRPGKPFPPHELVGLHGRQTLRHATHSDGHDVTALLAEIDGQHVSPARLRPPQLRGLAEPFSVTLDFGPLPTDRSLVLALTGWLRFGGGMANVAASHDPTLPFPFPQLEVEVAGGEWRPVDVVAGAPAGKTKSIIVDLTGKLPPDATRLRLSTAFEIHWDRIGLFERADQETFRVHRLDPAVTDLHWHGSGEHENFPWDRPVTPIHDKIRPVAPWHITPAGWCTRYGDVKELVTQKDNALVIMNCGDELTLQFPIENIPPKPTGHQRTFFVFTSGWDKDADYHVAAGTTVEPIPWHGMDDQLYGRQPRPAFANDAWIGKYNTRWVGPLTLSRQPSAR